MIDPFKDPDESWWPWRYPDPQGCVEGFVIFVILVTFLSLLMHH